MKELAIHPQTVYAKERGQHMADVTSVETHQPTAQNGEHKKAEEKEKKPSEEKPRGGDGKKLIERYWKQLADSGRIDREEAERNIREGKAPKVRGGARPILNDFAGPLEQIAAEINDEIARVGEPNPLPQNVVNRQIERVQNLIDQGTVDAEEGRRLLRSLSPLREEAEAGELVRRRRYEDLQDEVEGLRLEAREQGDFDPERYHNVTIRGIADEVQGAIQRNEATERYFSDKIAEVGQLRGELVDMAADEEAGHLMSQLWSLKGTLSNRAAAIRLELRTSEYSSYGEVRMTADQKKELINLALESVRGDKIADRELKRRFNQIFERADIRSSDDWREALGTAGSIEYDDFIITLNSVASGRMSFTLPEGMTITTEDKRAIEQKVRELAQEAKLRNLLHDLSYYVNRNFGTEDVHKVMSGFVVEDADRAFREPGVAHIAHLYEQAMFHTMAKHGGFLPYEAMVNKVDLSYGEVEQFVWDQVQGGKEMGIAPFRDMEDWEIKRAISLARGMGIATGRSIEIAAMTGIAKGAPLVSWWANTIIKKIAFFRQVTRYDIGFARNKILAYRLEHDPKSIADKLLANKVWTKRELTEIANLQVEEILDRFVNEDQEDRLIDMINPFRIGSLFTQTGWRYGEEKVSHAGAIAKLLDGNPFNPLIGTGMWIEKQRGKLNHPVDTKKKLTPDEKRILVETFGGRASGIETQGQQAEFLIRTNLELSARISPLKLFYNMMGLRQEVLRSYYANRTDSAGKPYVDELSKGEIRILSDELNDDLNKLAVIQEKLQRIRADRYKEYYAAVDRGEQVSPPNLYEEFADLDREIRESLQNNPEQAARILAFVGHVQGEFAKDNQKGKLMRNLRDKGWKIPFVFGTDDLPYDLYEFTKTGGSAFERRWGDIESAAKGADAYEQLIEGITNFQSQDDIIKALDAIYQNVRGHDEGVASEVATRAVEGIIKFFKKDAVSRLPAGVGTLIGFTTGQSSFAQLAYGRSQMAWDEPDIDTFIRKANAAGLLGRPAEAKARIKELREKTGAENWNMAIAFFRTGSSLFLLAFLYYMLSKTALDDLREGKVLA